MDFLWLFLWLSPQTKQKTKPNFWMPCVLVKEHRNSEINQIGNKGEGFLVFDFLWKFERVVHLHAFRFKSHKKEIAKCLLPNLYPPWLGLMPAVSGVNLGGTDVHISKDASSFCTTFFKIQTRAGRVHHHSELCFSHCSVCFPWEFTVPVEAVLGRWRQSGWIRVRSVVRIPRTLKVSSDSLSAF